MSNIVATTAAAMAALTTSLVNLATPPRGQFTPDLTDRELLAWSALVCVGEEQGGVIHALDLVGCASLFSLSKAETFIIANVLRNTLLSLEAQS